MPGWQCHRVEAASKVLAAELAVEEIAAEEEVSAEVVKIEEEAVIFSVVTFKDIAFVKEISAEEGPVVVTVAEVEVFTVVAVQCSLPKYPTS